MGHIVHASEEWQLLSAVHLIFAAQAPAINLADLSGADKDVCLNLLTIFDFEIWLVPDALQEAQALSLAGNTSNLASRALASLLGVFEQYVDDIVKSRGGDNHEVGMSTRPFFSSRARHLCILCKGVPQTPCLKR